MQFNLTVFSNPKLLTRAKWIFLKRVAAFVAGGACSRIPPLRARARARFWLHEMTQLPVAFSMWCGARTLALIRANQRINALDEIRDISIWCIRNQFRRWSISHNFIISGRGIFLQYLHFHLFETPHFCIMWREISKRKITRRLLSIIRSLVPKYRLVESERNDISNNITFSCVHTFLILGLSTHFRRSLGRRR